MSASLAASIARQKGDKLYELMENLRATAEEHGRVKVLARIGNGTGRMVQDAVRAEAKAAVDLNTFIFSNMKMVL